MWRYRYVVPILFFAAIVLVSYLNIRDVDLHNASHWVYGWDHGFISRGLVGTITDVIWGDTSRTHAFINTASFLVFCALMGLVLLMLTMMIQRDQAILPATLLGLLFIFNPGSISFLAHDLGRFDAINYTILLCLAMIILISDRSVTLAFISGVFW
jgi:hypothetical protein